MSKDGLSDHDLLMEVREDVKWIKEHLAHFPPRKEVYGILATILTITVALFAALN